MSYALVQDFFWWGSFFFAFCKGIFQKRAKKSCSLVRLRKFFVWRSGGYYAKQGTKKMRTDTDTEKIEIGYGYKKVENGYEYKKI